MSNELAKANVSIIHNVDDLGRIGKMMAESGYFTDARQAAQAGVKVLAGQEMGFGAFASMTGIYIIQGKPSVGANLMASAVKANPKYDYRVKEHNDNVCSIEFFEYVDGKKESIGVSEFTLKEARTAGVKNLDKYPRNMLFARAMSNGIRWYCPDVFSGNVTYTPEELGANVDGEGNVVSIEEPKPRIAEATPEPVIEGEIVKPINNTPVPQKPAEAPQKPAFDADEFLRNFTPDPTLPYITPANAVKIVDSKGNSYGTLSTEELYKRMMGCQKGLKKLDLTDEQKDMYLHKLGAIHSVLSDRKAKKFVKPADDGNPFVKGTKDVQNEE